LNLLFPIAFLSTSIVDLLTVSLANILLIQKSLPNKYSKGVFQVCLESSRKALLPYLFPLIILTFLILNPNAILLTSPVSNLAIYASLFFILDSFSGLSYEKIISMIAN
jgi:hypothetical protein